MVTTVECGGGVLKTGTVTVGTEVVEKGIMGGGAAAIAVTAGTRGIIGTGVTVDSDATLPAGTSAAGGAEET
jgi:hypothetical protein